jgi:flagellar hook assembly protein FlgD
MIYETEDYVDGGWDGTYKGNKAPNGAYVYIVTYSSADGEEYERKGTISLTR